MVGVRPLLLNLDVPLVRIQLVTCWDARCDIFFWEVIDEALESNHYYGEIVKRSLTCRVLHERINYLPAHLMDRETRWSVVVILGIRDKARFAFLNSLPCQLLNLEVGHAIENAIAAHHYKVLVLIDILTTQTVSLIWFRLWLILRFILSSGCLRSWLKDELCDFRLSNNHSRLATILFKLRFDIPKCSAHA